MMAQMASRRAGKGDRRWAMKADRTTRSNVWRRPRRSRCGCKIPENIDSVESAIFSAFHN
jgi:hypothetical protein